MKSIVECYTLYSILLQLQCIVIFDIIGLTQIRLKQLTSMKTHKAISVFNIYYIIICVTLCLFNVFKISVRK